GTNPGKHGIFSFATRKPGTYEREITNPGRIKTPTLPEILKGANLTTGLLNAPMTPKDTVRGFTIPGFLARDEGTPKPPRIAKKIEKELGLKKIPGDIETPYLKNVKDNPEALLDRAKDITQQLGETALLLLEEEWNLFMTVFMAMDRVQHFFWRHIDENHPNHTENHLTAKARDVMKTIDTYVGKIADALDENTLLIILSDHGFCPIHTEIYLNNHLETQSLTERHNNKVDQPNSKAVAYGYGDIWINLQGREPNGQIKPGNHYEALRRQIARYLTHLTIDGQKPIKTVKRREEVYTGPETPKAPDLLAIFNPGWQAARHPEFLPARAHGNYVNRNPRWSGGHDGTHDPRDVPGILIVNGPRVKKQRHMKANLWDLAPTILQALGQPIPPHMDGKPLPIWEEQQRA
ncbi:MAG: alkaline phosphatase family protein, partial [Candidatus Geothermarchaeales archaeon]